MECSYEGAERRRNNGRRVEDQESLCELRKLTNALPTFPVTIETNSRIKEHKMIRGTSIAENLKNIPETSCAAWFNSKDSIFPAHAHSEREWIIIYKGSMDFAFEGEEIRTLHPGDYVYIEPHTVHYANFQEDCHYFAITVPRSESWPE